MRHKVRDSGGKFPCCCCCATILVYCLIRDWTRICCIIEFENTQNHPSTPYRIRCGFIFFSTLESGFKNIRIRYRIRWMRVDSGHVWKEKVADSKISA